MPRPALGQGEVELSLPSGAPSLGTEVLSLRAAGA